MDDPIEIRERIGRLLKRVKRRDDYGALLATGQVILKIDEVEDPESWRAAIRHNARADRIKVRTGQTEGIVWALLHEAGNPSRSSESRRYNKVLEVVVPRAVDHRHEPLVALRDGDEALFTCQRCDSLGYADAASGPLIGGGLFEDDCPHEEPPEDTALTWFIIPRRP
jgi:hypothetical protein